MRSADQRDIHYELDEQEEVYSNYYDNASGSSETIQNNSFNPKIEESSNNINSINKQGGAIRKPHNAGMPAKKGIKAKTSSLFKQVGNKLKEGVAIVAKKVWAAIMSHPVVLIVIAALLLLAILVGALATAQKKDITIDAEDTIVDSLQ